MNINAKDARWPGCSAENFGRFIPCRGGGTATTYYTDEHVVDEDVIAISVQGGKWRYEDSSGITHRLVFNSSSYAADDVASRLIYLS